MRFISCAAAAMAAACTSGLDPGQPVAAELNQQGGTISMGATASLQVGAGSLAAPKIITVAPAQPAVPLPAAAAGTVVSFTPHGTVFSLPATITLKYDAAQASRGLRVLRLASDTSTAWEPVGGARFVNGVATFETTHFSYYAVAAGYDCTPLAVEAPCGCGAGSFCAPSGCVPVASATACENPAVLSILGDFGAGTNQTDVDSANAVAAALQAACGATSSSVPQSQDGVLDPCTDAPLAGAGTTIVLAGGYVTERAAGYLDAQKIAPLSLSIDPSPAGTSSFVSRAGTVLREFQTASLGHVHDYVAIALSADPARGALILNLYGIYEHGTQAAVWYFVNRVLPDMAAGRRSFSSYALLEWTDDGDGLPGATDTWAPVAQDVP